MQLRKFLSALALLALVILTPLVAMADTVDNPGDVTIAVDEGSFVQIKNQNFNFGGGDPLSTVNGMVDSDGNLTFPADQTDFQPIPLTVPGTGITVIVQLEATQDGRGTINPLTGDGTLILTLRVKLSAGPLLPPECQIPATTISMTTGTSGSLTGAPYDTDSGTATLVSNNFFVPAARDCGGFTDLINLFLGLPSLNPSENKVQLNVIVDPILIGS